MAFTVEEFRDIVRIIEQHPDWRAELRRLVLTDELLALPGLVRELTEAQKRTEERVGRLEVAVADLAEAQKRTEERVAALAELQQRLVLDVSILAQAMTTMGRDVADLKGTDLERKYRALGPAYFSPIVRRAHVLSMDELQDMLWRAADRGYLSEDEVVEILWADVVVRGQKRKGQGEIFLVVEVSWGVGSFDVGRAVRRSGLLAKTGVQVLPVVAGKSITAEAAAQAREMKVWQVIDGHAIPLEPTTGEDK